MYHLLPDVTKAIHLCNDRNVAMHLTIHLNILHHLVAIGLQATIEVVQFDARHPACSPIEELRGDIFHQLGVVTHLLPTRNKVVALFLNHLIEFRDFIGAVLQVGVHSDDHVAFHDLKALVQSRRLAIVSPET